MRNPCICLLVFVSLFICTALNAQAPDASVPVNNFAKLFPNPTGQNGYEELVRAGDILANSQAWNDYEKSQGEDKIPTLAMKRRVVADTQVRMALETLRTGLKKPVRSPRTTLDDETILPELARFRSLARLIGVEIYVQLADGRVPLALDTLAEALKFGYVAQTDTLISSLVSVAIDAIVIRSIADHLDQLSVRDCEKLTALVKDWLALPDPAIPILQLDKKGAATILNKYKSDPIKLMKMLEPGNTSPDQKERHAQLEQAVAANPNAASGLFDQAGQIVAGQYDQAIAGLSQPVWQRAPLKPADKSTQAGLLADLLAGEGMLNSVMDRYAREQAQVQMLGVHAAIRRYLWEYSSLPGGLQELKLGSLIIDPFNGRPFDYKTLEGTKYSLSSVGPIDRNPGPGAPAGQRIPIEIPPKPRPQ